MTAVNLALALSAHADRPKVGILDLDIFGPSLPKLMGLEGMGQPNLTPRTSRRTSLTSSSRGQQRSSSETDDVAHNRKSTAPARRSWTAVHVDGIPAVQHTGNEERR